MQDNREYDLEILEFFCDMIDLNFLLNPEKTEIFLGIHHKYRYEMPHTRQMHTINNDLYMSYEMWFHGQLQLNVLHILFLNGVLKDNNVEKKCPMNLLFKISMYISKFYSN